MKFPVVLYPSDEGYAFEVPRVPGCWSQGETTDEALVNCTSAIQDNLDAEIDTEDGAEIVASVAELHGKGCCVQYTLHAQ